MQRKTGQLPDALGDVINEEATKTDEIFALKEQLDSAQSALEEQAERIKDLSNEVRLLKDNSEIKLSAYRYAKWFMILVPVVCLLLLLITAFDSLGVQIDGRKYEVAWDANVGEFAEAAFVFGPIVFVATVLGVLFRGVFGQSSKDDEASLAKVAQQLTNNS